MSARPGPPADPVCLLPGEDALLRFPSDVPLRRQVQPAAARRHPGKLDLYLLRWLADRYLAPGSRVIDPMCGAGGILYLTLPPWGCHITGVELEPAWAAAANATWAHLQGALVAPTGTATIRCGDARAVLPTLAGGADVALFSPPYGDALTANNGHIGPGLRAMRQAERPRTAAALDGWRYDAALLSPPYGDALSGQRHSDSGSQLRELAHNARGGAAGRQAQRVGYGPTRNPAQIGNLAGSRYTAAMAAVYAALVPCIRPGGLVIVVIKNIVRARQEVDLVGQARAQLVALGCRPVATHWRAVRPGPFHHIRAKADPGALVIDREAALVLEVE